MEIDFSKIEQYNRQYQKWLQTVPAVYNYDNCLCCCFAHLLSNQAEKDGFKTSKVCALVSDRGDSSQGVSAFMQNSQGGFEQIKWDYHMAFAIDVPIYKDSPVTEILVADPVLFGKNLVTLKQWKQTLACPDYGFIRAPKGERLQASPRGYWLSSEEPQDLDSHAMQEIGKLKQQVERQEMLENSLITNPQLAKELNKNKLARYLPLKSIIAQKATILQNSSLQNNQKKGR